MSEFSVRALCKHICIKISKLIKPMIGKAYSLKTQDNLVFRNVDYAVNSLNLMCHW
jgi:hypothetical protein